MQYGDLITEMGGKGVEHLGRQGNFRYQKDGGLPFFQAVIDQMDIHAGFAAAGHAEKQSNGSSSRSGQP